MQSAKTYMHAMTFTHISYCYTTWSHTSESTLKPSLSSREHLKLLTKNLYITVIVKWSCHVIVRNRLSLSMGLQGVAAGANPSLVSGRGQGTPWTSRQFIAGPSLMSNVGFNISLKDTLTCSSALPRAGIWISNLLITSRPALPAELQPPCKMIKYYQLSSTKSWTLIATSCFWMSVSSLRFWID